MFPLCHVVFDVGRRHDGASFCGVGGEVPFDRL
jgi:hypothetical protein